MTGSSLRVLVVATNIDVPGTHGGSTHVGELMAALSESAQTMLLARRGSHGPGVHGVGLWPRTPPFGLRHALSTVVSARSLAAVRRFAPQVIYERASSYGTGALLGLATGAPSVCMVLDEHHSPLSLHYASRIIATDTTLVPARYRHKAVQVSWGANVERFRPDVDTSAVRRRFALDGRRVVTYAGSFRNCHGVDVLLDAVARHRGAPLTVLLVGDGPERAALQARAATNGGDVKLLFTGAQPYDDMPAILAASDVFVAPFVPERHPLSARRGFVLDPLKLFESLAAEVPTISVRARNIEALFTDGEHLALTPSGDAAALAAAIDRMLDTPEVARAMARRGAEKVRREHTWRAHAQHLLRLFAEVRSASAAA
ncbi:MAG: glycosyltransferase [Deltaproteobacteria bacterium]|nr:glycosyltransferase [Deltaproteobacteria bacterium]